MKNVTVTVDDSALEWVRIEAAKRTTSVSRLVDEMQAEKMRHEGAYGQAMREASKFAPLPFEGRFLTRDEIHADRLDRFR